MRLALLALALLTFLVAFVIAFSGGFAATVAGWRVSARNPGTAMAQGPMPPQRLRAKELLGSQDFNYLGYYDVEHTKPVFHGDTIRVRSEVVEKRPTSKPDRGLVEIRHVVTNQHGVEVLTYKRRALVKMRPH